MTRRAIALVLLTAFSFGSVGTLSAQTPNDSESTPGILRARNGRYWNRLTEPEKLAYLMGFQEAASIVALATTPSYERFREVTDSYLGQSTFGELVDGLNAFYADPANRPIAVIRAMLWYQNKTRGQTAAELQQQLEKLRANVAMNTAVNSK